MLKTYYVQVPIAGFCSVEITAESEEEAIESALSRAFDGIEIDCKGPSELVEVNAYRKLHSGNVLHAPLREVQIESVEDA